MEEARERGGSEYIPLGGSIEKGMETRREGELSCLE